MRLIIIGDLNGYFSSACAIAINHGAKVRHCSDIEGAFISLRSGNGADLILIEAASDVKNLILKLEQEKFAIPVVACGFDNNKEHAVNSIRYGAKEYIKLPPNEEIIAALLESISTSSKPLLYKSEAMESVVSIARQIAKSEASVLITGKSGCGKEIMARFIHDNSLRKANSFIAINCAAIPENLIESELFGHEKGAFTGAIDKRIGKFEEAHNGTILLDEISETDIRIQAKLLRVIQEREITRIGGNNSVNVNVRILATSNRDLLKEVKEGRFREDLYFRLNVINLHLPILSQRPDDIILLASFFVDKFSKANNLPAKIISNAAIKELESYPWPGNVRELENTIYRAVLLSQGTQIEPKDLMLSSNSNIVDDAEKNMILSTFRYCLGDRSQAATILGINLNQLTKKLEQYEQSELEDAAM